jgi:hypothetical protein
MLRQVLPYLPALIKGGLARKMVPVKISEQHFYALLPALS